MQTNRPNALGISNIKSLGGALCTPSDAQPFRLLPVIDFPPSRAEGFVTSGHDMALRVEP